MSLPILVAAQPTEVPAKVFDKWWVQTILIQAPNPNGDASAHVVLGKFRTDENGVAELSGETQTLDVPALLSAAQTDPELGAVVAGLLGYVMKVGQQQGVVYTEPAPEPEPTPEG
jgi:hypothetical protein